MPILRDRSRVGVLVCKCKTLAQTIAKRASAWCNLTRRVALLAAERTAPTVS